MHEVHWFSEIVRDVNGDYVRFNGHVDTLNTAQLEELRKQVGAKSDCEIVEVVELATGRRSA